MQQPEAMANLGGQTTKKTYVTTYTTDVDPRTLPDFDTRGAVPAEGWRGDGGPGERRASARLAPSRPHDWQGHPNPPRPAYGPPPSHHSGAPSRGRGYRPHPPPTPHHGEHGYGEASASTSSATTSLMSTAMSAGKGSLHRLRKRYTTTTVTTITTTTILLPRMQEAYVFPPVTSHHVDQQHNAGESALPYAITGGDTHGDAESLQPRLHRIENGGDKGSRLEEASALSGSRLVPSKPQRSPNGEVSQAWKFHQHTANQVETESRGRLPTLQDLGITSYFTRDDVGTGGVAPKRREAPYAPASSSPSDSGTPLRQQPWVAGETRCEVEGGKRYY
ncbi:hypothetical protein LSCM1_05751 [Leishmania martiniquensis]|uniref:Uncharacterized protein n=1 Tax=Leishmania martiniquensis TaxID=1580590 RepID=A0A836HPZ2_9TRYP|nr:hypothetical protein LSCM1_05751 [Leishmania martiniquensis]